MSLCFSASAQSYVTYNHDAAKMNQITVQEIGAGGLTPAFYYDVFHNRYQKTAAQKNKQGFRTLAGVSHISRWILLTVSSLHLPNEQK